MDGGDGYPTGWMYSMTPNCILSLPLFYHSVRKREFSLKQAKNSLVSFHLLQLILGSFLLKIQYTVLSKQSPAKLAVRSPPFSCPPLVQASLPRPQHPTSCCLPDRSLTQAFRCFYHKHLQHSFDEIARNQLRFWKDRTEQWSSLQNYVIVLMETKAWH